MKRVAPGKFKTQTHRAGFTLVETALALLVIAIGMLTIAGLFPFALEQGKKSSDETFAAFLADTAFASIRAAADSAEVDWNNLDTYYTIPPVTISDPSVGTDVFWSDSMANLRMRANGQIRTQVFVAASNVSKWPSMPFPTSWEQYDHALRYRMTLRSISPRLAGVTLEIWPGEYGTNATPYRFYTEVFNHGY